MPLLQKIRRPTVRIVGTDYSSRLVGLHNRVRAYARRLLVYKDLARLQVPAGAGTRGIFVSGRKRLFIYIKRGSPESTIAHELVHALLYGEGYLPLRCRTDDLTAHPEIGMLAGKISDLIVHPVVLDRLRLSGYGDDPAGSRTDGGPSPGQRPQARNPSSACDDDNLAALSDAVGAAEAIHRLPRAARALGSSGPSSSPSSAQPPGIRIDPRSRRGGLRRGSSGFWRRA
jgi:hypothetical protein